MSTPIRRSSSTTIVRRTLSGPNASQVAGLRYFNVYGPREAHKGAMASVAFHLFNQIERGENPKLFGAYDGFGPGEQSRDFIHVGDVADVNLWLWKRGTSGIFNCGTGRAQPFRTVAETVIDTLGKGEIEFVDFPDHLKGRYQSFTQADMTRLRAAGYNGAFRSVETGVRDYVTWLKPSILVIGPRWVGDMVMAQCLFSALKQVHPGAAIDVMAPAWAAPLVERMPEVRARIDAPFSRRKLEFFARRRLGRSLSRPLRHCLCHAGKLEVGAGAVLRRHSAPRRPSARDALRPHHRHRAAAGGPQAQDGPSLLRPGARRHVPCRRA